MDPETEAGEARAQLVDRLVAAGAVRSEPIEAAFRAVPRHEFVERVAIETAYADIAIATKRTESGEAISSLSQPTMVATMLEHCHLAPGDRVLEIGTGTGYNAALIRYLVGVQHPVVTIELDDELAGMAERRLRRLGIDGVEVIVGDGASGYPDRAPYDCIIVTTGAPGVAPAWVDQLVDGGRLVAPIVDASGLGAVHCSAKRGADLQEEATVPCGFLPMRSPPTE